MIPLLCINFTKKTVWIWNGLNFLVLGVTYVDYCPEILVLVQSPDFRLVYITANDSHK